MSSGVISLVDNSCITMSYSIIVSNWYRLCNLYIKLVDKKVGIQPIRTRVSK